MNSQLDILESQIAMIELAIQNHERLKGLLDDPRLKSLWDTLEEFREKNANKLVYGVDETSPYSQGCFRGAVRTVSLIFTMIDSAQGKAEELKANLMDLQQRRDILQAMQVGSDPNIENLMTQENQI